MERKPSLRKIIRVCLRLLRNCLLLVTCAALAFIAFSGSQPMAVDGAPPGMTYFEFMQDRITAARGVEPSRCGWGLLLSLAALAPVYTVVYTAAAVNPEGRIARITAPDPDIAADAAGARWSEIPGIWWHTLERLSWTLLGKPHAKGCQLGPVPLPDGG